MKTLIKFTMSILLCMLGQLNAASIKGEEREWTNKDGNTVKGKLADVDGDKIKVLIRGKIFDLNLQNLDQADRDYVNEMKPKPPAGAITEYEAVFADDEQRAFYKENDISSMVWNGDDPVKKLPFVLHVPKPRTQTRREFPIIIHLSGTGGIGKNNTSTVFQDAGGVAKTFFSDELQKKDPCYVMIPQAPREGAWFSASYTDPSDTLSWVVTALSHLMEDRRYSIDPDRVYITGLSMGGAGVYQAMAKFPDVFAAGIPISYVESHELFNEDNVGNMWVVLNSGDKGQPLSMLEDFKKRYRELGGKIKTTVYDRGGHDAWKTMLGDQEFRIWLFSQKRRDSR